LEINDSPANLIIGYVRARLCGPEWKEARLDMSEGTPPEQEYFIALEKRSGMVSLYLADLLLLSQPVNQETSKRVLRQLYREQARAKQEGNEDGRVN
jgi:hypothetical protein